MTVASGDTPDGDGTTHHHKTVEISPGQPIPSVDLVVHQDAKKGWNLEVKVTNFSFAPESVNTADKPGEGHAHLNVNGKKIARLYGNWYYLENLPPGKNIITVSLNANNHESLVNNGKLIQDTEIIEVPARSFHKY
ncbi:hypothetical protein [Mastigocladopsis repens]|uniref:hypothetical protein n=1 Tax=Mastigocladopsis repens TaxID=221287 RepID=UPI0002E3BD3B|nr:hypothetical protein [Mastigocladopsis repens]